MDRAPPTCGADGASICRKAPIRAIPWRRRCSRRAWMARRPQWSLTAEYDTLRDEGEAYARKLGVAARRYPGTIHAFFTMLGTLQVTREAMQDAAEFLRRHW